MSENSNRRINSIGKQNYGTPYWLLNVLHKAYSFTVDACADSENAKLPRYWTEEIDGLAQSWAGERVFCNPPFENVLPWVEKAILETSQNACQLALILCNNDCSTSWWGHGFANSSQRIFINRRLRYIGAPQAQMVSSLCFVFTPLGFKEQSKVLRITSEQLKAIDMKM